MGLKLNMSIVLFTKDKILCLIIQRVFLWGEILFYFVILLINPIVNLNIRVGFGKCVPDVKNIVDMTNEFLCCDLANQIFIHIYKVVD